MRTWKKALSAALSAALLASITASGAFAAKGALATDSDQTNYLNCAVAVVHDTTTCQQAADGLSEVGLAGDIDGADAPKLYITISGASFVGAAGDLAGADFTLAGGVVTAPSGAVTAADTIRVKSPSAPGSAVVTVYTIDAVTGVAAVEGTLTITFTASTGLGLDGAKSLVAITGGACPAVGAYGVVTKGAGSQLIDSAPAGTTLTAVGCVWALLKDGNGNAYTGATVKVAISGQGLLSNGTVSAQQLDAVGGYAITLDAAGTAYGGYAATLWSTGLQGTGTISVQVTKGTEPTFTFPPTTFGFTGPVASAALSGGASKADAGLAVDAFTLVIKDSTGNEVDADVLTWSSTPAGIANAQIAAGTKAGRYSVTCPTATTVEYVVKVKADSMSGATLVSTATSNTVKVYCGPGAAAKVVLTGTATMAPGTTQTLTATVSDAAGFPVVDGSVVTALAAAGGNTAPSATAVGVSTFAYVAPNTTGPATVWAFSGTASDDLTISIGAAAAAGSNASALGATKTGTYTAATKIAALGTYQTFQLCYGAGASGQMVGILVATKNSAGVWSSFTRLTGRAADSAGCAYFWWRTASAAWISVQGDLGGSLTPAVQGRWR